MLSEIDRLSLVAGKLGEDNLFNFTAAIVIPQMLKRGSSKIKVLDGSNTCQNYHMYNAACLSKRDFINKRTAIIYSTRMQFTTDILLVNLRNPIQPFLCNQFYMSEK